MQFRNSRGVYSEKVKKRKRKDKNVENITLGQVTTILAFLVALIGSIEYLFTRMKKWLKNTFKEELEPINQKLDELSQKDKDLELNEDKNFLVEFLKDADEGNISETEKERFYEVYERYHQLGGNSYITSKVEELKKEGKL